MWVFSRDEMLKMMDMAEPGLSLAMLTTSAPSEWFVWGSVPEEFVVNRDQL